MIEPHPRLRDQHTGEAMTQPVTMEIFSDYV
jgi:hypothetical protein